MKIHRLAQEWRVELDESFETPSSIIAYGRRGSQRVVLKVVKRPNDEWHAGDALAAFDGRGVVRVLEHTAGAMLLERLDPGTPLVVGRPPRQKFASNATHSPGLNARITCPCTATIGSCS